MKRMIKHQILKRNKFLLNCGSFILVSFSANKQPNFLAFKEFLYTHNLKVKFVKSKSIKKCLENNIEPDLLISLKTVSSSPLLIIKPKTDTNFINTFFNFSQKFFVDSKTFLLSCFYRGKAFFSNNLFSLKNETPEKFLKTTYSFYVNTFQFFNSASNSLLNILKCSILNYQVIVSELFATGDQQSANGEGLIAIGIFAGIFSFLLWARKSRKNNNNSNPIKKECCSCKSKTDLGFIFGNLANTKYGYQDSTGNLIYFPFPNLVFFKIGFFNSFAFFEGNLISNIFCTRCAPDVIKKITRELFNATTANSYGQTFIYKDGEFLEPKSFCAYVFKFYKLK